MYKEKTDTIGSSRKTSYDSIRNSNTFLFQTNSEIWDEGKATELEF